ncbi:4-amino-4-deoxychorismate lyase [Anaerosacchariphilus polymeriproducens]|uniref:4-amino-4-deoxychorismate lyase n=2 Tax=Anaerosacchariphilus polymeriproducens TaxID=1812858 RepID=A0A371AYG1_9FIRM|nr:4-amino-4-deoxychorismate lyase [Anaerosacchariphilus polymeriproducens]
MKGLPNMNNFNIDNGFYFGIGVYETISVINGKLIMADRHWNRMEKGIKKLGFKPPFSSFETVIEKADIYLKKNFKEKAALKVVVSPKNFLFKLRNIPYTPDQYQKGFSLNISTVQKNETSIFTYIKSLNNGDNWIEKQTSIKKGFDEPVFLNSKGMLTEGATTNLFFVKDKKLYTPSIECGLLPGTIRDYLLEKYGARELVIFPEDIKKYDEMFITNSLMGIMPVSKINKFVFSEREMTQLIMKDFASRYF